MKLQFSSDCSNDSVYCEGSFECIYFLKYLEGTKVESNSVKIGKEMVSLKISPGEPNILYPLSAKNESWKFDLFIALELKKGSLITKNSVNQEFIFFIESIDQI